MYQKITTKIQLKDTTSNTKNLDANLTEEQKGTIATRPTATPHSHARHKAALNKQ